jgi:hypothetical protein
VVEIKEESGEEGDSDDDDDDDDDAVVVGSGGSVAADAAAAAADADEAAVDASNKPPPSLPLESPPPPPPSLEQVCMAVRSLNPRCEILKATKGAVPIDQLLGIRAFDLKCQVASCGGETVTNLFGLVGVGPLYIWLVWLFWFDVVWFGGVAWFGMVWKLALCEGHGLVVGISVACFLFVMPGQLF